MSARPTTTANAVLWARARSLTKGEAERDPRPFTSLTTCRSRRTGGRSGFLEPWQKRCQGRKGVREKRCQEPFALVREKRCQEPFALGQSPGSGTIGRDRLARRREGQAVVELGERQRDLEGFQGKGGVDAIELLEPPAALRPHISTKSYDALRYSKKVVILSR